jgi:hypothetical protein
MRAGSVVPKRSVNGDAAIITVAVISLLDTVFRGPMSIDMSITHVFHCRAVYCAVTIVCGGSRSLVSQCTKWRTDNDPLQRVDQCALLHSEPAAGHNSHEVPATTVASQRPEDR